MKVRIGAKQHNIDHFIDKVQTKYHFDKKDSIDLKRIYMEMLKLIDAKAIYKINQRVTGIKEIDDNQAAVVAITLGNEIDRLQEKYTEEQPAEEQTNSVAMVEYKETIFSKLKEWFRNLFNKKLK